mmetsp:Transcript_6826/g.12044  ORF Transcript_6826/g.12044 Transcript_6826/m.12044 type:complete len:431 (+) Transcript_6826:155-1447(+)
MVASIEPLVPLEIPVISVAGVEDGELLAQVNANIRGNGDCGDETEVLFEGKLWHMRADGGAEQTWSQAQAKLTMTGITLAGNSQNAEEIFMELGAEHYVGDSNRREHGFLLSDFEETVYFAAVTEATKQKWMQTLATVLRKIGTREREGQSALQSPSRGSSNQAQRPEDDAPSAALLELRGLQDEYQAALEWLNECVELRRKAQRRANDSLVDENKRREQERIEKERTELQEKRRREQEEKAREEQRKWQEQQAKLKALDEERQRKQREEAEQLIEQKKAQAERHKSVPKAAPGGILSRIQGWNKQVEGMQEADRENPFSANFSGPAAPRPGEEGYGRAKAGTKTAERAAKAQEWVDKEIDKFVSVVKDIGEPGPDGKISVTFGKLFITYQDISDTLVGIMMRAKKRKHIHYEGDMLFQGRDNHVLVTLL